MIESHQIMGHFCRSVWFSADLPALWTLWICLNIVLYQSLGLSTVCGERNSHKDLCAVKCNIYWIAEVRKWKGFQLFYRTLLRREKHALSPSRDPYFTHREFNLCHGLNELFIRHIHHIGRHSPYHAFRKCGSSLFSGKFSGNLMMTKSPFFLYTINNLVKKHLHQAI